MKMKSFSFLLILVTVLGSSCTKEKKEPKLIVKYTFDENQERLDNFGNPSVIPAGHAAQTPNFKKIGIHSLELLNTPYVLPSEGSILYKGKETTQGGAKAIDFENEKLLSDGDVLVEVPLKSIKPGTYTYLRNSLAFQKYEIDVMIKYQTTNFKLKSTLASFIGYNTYIKDFTIKQEKFSVNANRKQGYWAVETNTSWGNFKADGQAVGTTVPNVLAATSPIPLNSCLVTGAFKKALTITGNETEDIVLNVKIGINESFEWKDLNGNGEFEPAANENVVDMGIRGLVVEY